MLMILLVIIGVVWSLAFVACLEVGAVIIRDYLNRF
jgi:hypothetical protein